MKKIVTIFLCLILFITPAYAVEGLKTIVTTCERFNPSEHINEYMNFKTTSNIEFNTDFYIPVNSVITIKYEKSVKEKRFHKSGYFTGQLVSYTKDDETVKITANIEVIGRRYEKISGKDAAKTGTELTLSTAAGFIIPGIDIAYYFVKGAIQNTKADTRFKSGVHNAYDNSILWVFEKGKPIVLNEGDTVKLFIYKKDGIVKDCDLEGYSE